jgi:hypothetical protein
MELLLTDSARSLDKDFDEPSFDNETTAGKPADVYTMKIVLTLTVDAPSREQAEVLASHVAAFLPEDAQRVADAFSPVIMVPRANEGTRQNSRNSRTRSAVATAFVTMVTDGPPEGAPDALPAASNPANLTRGIRGTRPGSSPVRSRMRPAVRPSPDSLDMNGASLYTRRTY